MTGQPAATSTLARTRLRALLVDLLDDGTGTICPELQVLADQLVGMPRPDRARNWLRNNPSLVVTLRGLARGQIPLTHEALHDLPSWRTAAHLRDLLMASGALPPMDRQIGLFESWARHRLAAIDDAEHARLLRQFTTWHQLPALRAAACRAPLNPGARNGAAFEFTQAVRLLGWLADNELTLPTLDQGDLDRWHADHGAHPARAFLRWAARGGHTPRLELPRRHSSEGPWLPQQQRLDWIRRALLEDAIALRTRVAASLLLLYAQPVTRLVRLTIDDVLDTDDGVFLRLGQPATPVPEPFGAMLRQLAGARANMNTAANPDSRWLFPGGRAGQPLTAGALRQQFQALGLPTIPARTAALRQLVLQAPAPVVAAALGYGDITAQRHRAAAAGTWSRYTASRP